MIWALNLKLNSHIAAFRVFSFVKHVSGLCGFKFRLEGVWSTSFDSPLVLNENRIVVHTRSNISAPSIGKRPAKRVWKIFITKKIRAIDSNRKCCP